MAEAFNQAPQFQQGYPYFWSRPTQEPKPDLSGKIAAEGIAKGIDTGAKVFGESVSDLDKAESRGIMNETYRRGDELMNRDLAGLYAEYQGLSGDRPQEIKDLPQTLGTYSDARANGKISNTDHDARIDSLAKELRAKHPGYRNEVDEYIRAATGRGSTANQLWTSLREDIDAQISTRNARVGKVEGDLIALAKEGVPGSSEKLQLLRSGKMDDIAAAGWMEKAMSFKYQQMRDEAEIKSMEKNKMSEASITDKVEKSSTRTLNDTVLDKLNTVEYGIGGGKFETIKQITDGLHAGTLPLTSEQAVQIKQMSDAAFAQTVGQWYTDQNHYYEGDKTKAQYLGDEKMKKIVASAKEMWDNYFDLISKDRNLSAATMSRELFETTSSDTARGYQQDPDTAAAARHVSGAVKAFGSQIASDIFSRILGDSSITKKMQSDLGATAVNAAVPHLTSRQVNFNAKVEDAQKNQLPPAYYQHLLDLNSYIGNKKVPIETKKDLAEYFYGVGNEGVISTKFSDKPNKFGGNDQHNVFDIMMSPKNTEELFKVGKEYPQVWDNYTRRANQEWSAITQQDIATLPELTEMPGISFGYDLNEHHIVAKVEAPTGTDYRTRHEYNRAQGFMRDRVNGVLNRINSATDKMKKIYELEGKDPGVEILGLLQAEGAPNKALRTSILDAIKHGINRPYDDSVQ